MQEVKGQLPDAPNMKLRQGISGFRHVDDPPLPICDLKSFRTHCHDAARSVGGQVLQSSSQLKNIETNFALTIIELDASQIAILLNRHFPVVGFAAPPSDTKLLQFIDCEELANALKATGEYEVLSRDELERAISPNEFQLLLPAEVEQANYWRPHRLGDIIFNFWD